MLPIEKIEEIHSKLDALQKLIDKIQSDENSFSGLVPDDHRRVEELLHALHEDIEVLEKGAEVIAGIMAGTGH
ncbi:MULTISPECIES: hypothetical protein [unclassified Prosthecochloris]|uniref:hypothetical protein n=1 Tax=unclassified Prosthecochloris TaxID=2632826 RepID=UPI00223E3417|nr:MULTISPECIES: hypothetical protein [unclassified Prosthecochloris]UZJ38567.1 hypothetical protein OO005_05070 [Prosthecochloris sp. SCSIO W1103]